MRKWITAISVGLLGMVVFHSSLAQCVPPRYVQEKFCVACHRSLNPCLPDRYCATKHAQAAPTADMKPVDVYRRSVGYNAADNGYCAAGVGCQDCHGAGSSHLRVGNAYKSSCIVLPSRLNQHQVLSLCGRCHGDYTVDGAPFAADFQPGDDLLAMKGFKLNSVTATGSYVVLNDFMASKHAASNVSCLACHTAHGQIGGKPELHKAVPELCLGCHKDPHKGSTKAPEIPAGVSCTDCHMPDGSHTFVAG